MTEAQLCLYYIAENMRMDKSISDEGYEFFQQAIKALEQSDILDKIRAEIEGNMESIIGKYNSSIPKFNMPSYKIARNKAREECISIIDKYRAEQEGKE